MNLFEFLTAKERCYKAKYAAIFEKSSLLLMNFLDDCQLNKIIYMLSKNIASQH